MFRLWKFVVFLVQRIFEVWFRFADYISLNSIQFITNFLAAFSAHSKLVTFFLFIPIYNSGERTWSTFFCIPKFLFFWPRKNRVREKNKKINKSQLKTLLFATCITHWMYFRFLHNAFRPLLQLKTRQKSPFIKNIAAFVLPTAPFHAVQLLFLLINDTQAQTMMKRVSISISQARHTHRWWFIWMGSKGKCSM